MTERRQQLERRNSFDLFVANLLSRDRDSAQDEREFAAAHKTQHTPDESAPEQGAANEKYS